MFQLIHIHSVKLHVPQWICRHCLHSIIFISVDAHIVTVIIMAAVAGVDGPL